MKGKTESYEYGGLWVTLHWCETDREDGTLEMFRVTAANRDRPNANVIDCAPLDLENVCDLLKRRKATP